MTAEVCIITRDRPLYLLEAIESIVTQNSSVRIRVSDNSTKDGSINFIEKYRDRFDYVRRDGLLSHFDHFNLVFSESSSDYLCVFHDDDRMGDGQLNMLLNFLESNQHYSAVGVNSFLIDQGSSATGDLFYRGPSKTISHPAALIRQYLNPDYGGVIPFSSYLYNMRLLGKIKVDSESARKYSDATFLQSCMEKGPIYWFSKPVGCVRVHMDTESHRSNTLDYKLYYNSIRLQGIYGLNRRDLSVYRYPRILLGLERRNRLNSSFRITFRLSFFLFFFSSYWRKKFFFKLFAIMKSGVSPR